MAINESYKHNPQQISEKIVADVFNSLTGDPEEDVIALSHTTKSTRYSGILTPMFHYFRIKDHGWVLKVSDEEKTKFGIKPDYLYSSGPDEDVLDYLTGAFLLRGAIGSCYTKQAKIDGTPEVDYNTGILDAPVFPQSLIPDAYATEPGQYLMEAEGLDAQMRRENPALHLATMRLADKLADRYTPRTIASYPDLSDPPGKAFSPRVREAWGQELSRTSLRTYAWFTPNQPNQIPVPMRPSA